jgi:hypothetical protein
MRIVPTRAIESAIVPASFRSFGTHLRARARGGNVEGVRGGYRRAEVLACGVRKLDRAHAAKVYSWMRPPSRSRLGASLFCRCASLIRVPA